MYPDWPENTSHRTHRFAFTEQISRNVRTVLEEEKNARLAEELFAHRGKSAAQLTFRATDARFMRTERTQPEKRSAK